MTKYSSTSEAEALAGPTLISASNTIDNKKEPLTLSVGGSSGLIRSGTAAVQSAGNL
jgi:hypothetical protein